MEWGKCAHQWIPGSCSCLHLCFFILYLFSVKLVASFAAVETWYIIEKKHAGVWARVEILMFLRRPWIFPGCCTPKCLYWSQEENIEQKLLLFSCRKCEVVFLYAAASVLDYVPTSCLGWRRNFLGVVSSQKPAAVPAHAAADVKPHSCVVMPNGDMRPSVADGEVRAADGWKEVTPSLWEPQLCKRSDEVRQQSPSGQEQELLVKMPLKWLWNEKTWRVLYH